MTARVNTSEDVALSLTIAVVASSPAPLLLLDDRCNIVAASRSFCDAFGGTPDTLIGVCLYALGEGAWDVSQLRSMLAATISDATEIEAYELDLRKPAGRPCSLIVQARRLTYLDLEQLRILVAVSDVTDSRADGRAKDDALRQNGILLQEVRHRVANSLQIIASVLLQNARTTQSDETRGYLKDAHHRVMSVAALERLLSDSDDGDVHIRTYFTKLCDSIAASMIEDRRHISLSVGGDDSVVDARVCVSLGLIVTELVINALKHAFPSGRAGKITIDYTSISPSWTLCVSDDGVGMPAGAIPLRGGLGTSIVQTLARELRATVAIASENPGTAISIKHVQTAPGNAGSR